MTKKVMQTKLGSRLISFWDSKFKGEYKTGKILNLIWQGICGLQGLILRGKEVYLSFRPVGHYRATLFIYLCSHICKPFSFLLFRLCSFKLKNMLLLIVYELIFTHDRLPKWLSVPVLKFRDNVMMLAYWVSVCCR